MSKMTFKQYRKLLLAMRPDLRPLHGEPMTRRELLAQGYITAAGSVMVPPVLSMLASSSAQAQSACVTSSGERTRYTPTVILDLGGGANLAGYNVMVGGRGGQQDYLAAGSYGTIGLAPGNEPQDTGIGVNTDLGLAFHPGSPMLAGILNGLANTEETDPAARAQQSSERALKMNGFVCCARSDDDTQNNVHNPLHYIAKFTGSGELATLVGTQDTLTGSRSTAAYINPAFASVQVNSAQSVLNLAVPGALHSLFAYDGSQDRGKKAIENILQATSKMSQSKVAQFNQQSVSAQLRELCAYSGAQAQLTKFDANDVSPLQDPAIAATFRLNNNPSDQETQAAAICKMVLDPASYAIGGSINLGGYDYHANPRATTDARDNLAGTIIGQVIQAASRIGTDVLLYVYSDGAISCRADATNLDPTGRSFAASSDSGSRGAYFALLYQHNATQRPEVRDGRNQFGAFTASGAVDSTAAPLAANVDNLAKTIALNYLALHGKESRFDELYGNTLGSFESFIAFNKIRDV